jgi:hypothetical protein
MTTKPVDTLHDNENAYPRAATIAASTARTASEDFGDINCVGAGGLIVYVEQSVIGTSQSFVTAAAPTLPFTSSAGALTSFKFNSVEYTLPAGTYTTLATLAAAVNGALNVATRFDTVVTVSVDPNGTSLRFTSVPTGVHAEAFAAGTTHDALAALGITAGWTIAHTSAGAADGVSATTVTIQGVTPAGTAYTLLASATITAVGLTRLRVSPSLLASPNAVANDLVPDTIRVSVAQANTNPVTYTISAVLTPEG